MGAALIKNLVTYCYTIEFTRSRQAASRTVRPRCLAFIPVSEWSRFPAFPYLATCHFPRRPVESKSSVAMLTASAGIHRGQIAPIGKYRVSAAGRKLALLRLVWITPFFPPHRVALSEYKRLTRYVAKQSKWSRSCGAPATSGSRTSRLGATGREPGLRISRTETSRHTAPSGIKETLREILHSAQSTAQAEPLLDKWYSWARRCRLEPIKAVAKMLKDH